MPKVYVSIGSNIERDKNIPSALQALAQQFGALQVSSIYETAAVGFSGEPFYNLVAAFDSELSIEEIAAALTAIEDRHGRDPASRKFAPRTLDLDLILYGDTIRQDRKPLLPRDEITRYAFMLEPLAEIAPTLRHPITGALFADLWACFDKTDLQQRRIEPAWQYGCRNG